KLTSALIFDTFVPNAMLIFLTKKENLTGAPGTIKKIACDISATEVGEESSNADFIPLLAISLKSETLPWV
ncbi:MAG TPA: hypothetical protein DCZ10_02625, partial [Pelotomaculum sp.]|nr:hypothetical protein [Pelotomaculum sp.]